MTSRLKRKLGDAGVDLSSSRVNENFCLIGTPLPPLEKSKDTGEFVPLWKQEVRDEKGRRRLHGAFTGGFSAGYFNTVGSKEGWTPSTFVSSRKDRGKVKAARPEDFMDEEDMQDLRDSRKLVDTTEQMDFTGRADERPDEGSDSIASALERSMLPPPTDSAGARILKKMGWKLGQGVGPRVSLRQRRIQDMQAASGHTLAADDIALPDDGDEEASKHTYAPRDTPVLLVPRKDNTHGLGYRPGMGLGESSGSGKERAGPNIAAGFGLGALNEADEDDLDIYDSGAPAARRGVAYDIIDREEEDEISISRRGQPRAQPQAQQVTSIPSWGTDAHALKRSSAFTQTFRDGQVVLPGFTLSDKPVAEDRWFALPDVPPGWKPDPRRVWGAGKENQPSPPQPQGPMPHEKWRTSGKTADERGNLLGETPLPAAPRSVFDFISQKDKERLQRIAAGLHDKPEAAATEVVYPRIDRHVAQSALKGYKPFATDPAKHARYTVYVESQADPEHTPQLQPQQNQSVDAFNKELADYAKAAEMFKPMSEAMAGRFTTAAHIEQPNAMPEGLLKFQSAGTEEQGKPKEEEPSPKKPTEEELSPKAQAARVGMFGPLTREVKPWQPDRLLCKRFGVAQPELKADDAAAAAPKTAADTYTKTDLEVAVAAERAQAEQERAAAGHGPRDLANVGLGEDETQGRDTLTYERPAMDVFKAIFASDDEDEGEDEEGGEGMEVDDPPPVPTPAIPVVEPPSEPAKPTVPEVVNMATFKPTFVPRAKESGEHGKTKKDKKKKEKRALVSFAEDEEGSLTLAPQAKKRKGKDKDKDRDGQRAKKKRKEEDVDDDAMWVEKPAPEAAKALEQMRPEGVTSNGNDTTPDPPSRAGRKRAIDFL
ncbi:uncharacterized protein SCHCODRAFT_02699468 [Schizophyllum commune H4-8]|uniref:uncharacterized protein n=1 Tax=Schizophyllum commune (strain H4-8 / FGSC 9210) TaxID=578458 RepID=UPI0021609E88|nr:uncharacterized protein SCHCODRAFT_02699468 [Schizophyllum commune H4-8]KAI5895592.1 hypothetical protein SCHCODRAFT_02699468 [Schizophyllum commune H4-8]